MIIKQNNAAISINPNLIRYVEFDKCDTSMSLKLEPDMWKVICHYSADHKYVLYFNNELEARELFEYLDSKIDTSLLDIKMAINKGQ